MSLVGRIAWTGLGLLVAVALLALFVWKPASERAFVQRTEGLLGSTEEDFEAITTSLVEETMSFSTAAATAAGEQRALAVQDIPLELFVGPDGGVAEGRLRQAVLEAISDPGATGGEKHAAVRAEILARTRHEFEKRLDHLRATRAAVAARHGADVSWRTLGAWGGMLLVLLGAWAVVLDRVVVRPVRALQAAVGRFGAGERGVRLEPRGAAELAELERAFNETAEAVERTEAENAELRSGLEEKVRERTAALLRAARASTAGTMAGGVAHEFNNLLSGILGCAQSALDDDLAPDVRESVEMIRKTASRGVGITDALLRATRAEPDAAPCDPAGLFEEALGEVRPPAGIEVVREFAPVEVSADAPMLRQVLSNLMRNAVDAMGGAGRLTLRVAQDEREVLLDVEDTGPGIEPAVREILFEPFVTTRRGGREGAGLGLFLSDRLVHAHGGRIEVDSEVGRGTRFRIHLPLARDS
jgi:signal transduction histidine kinase